MDLKEVGWKTMDWIQMTQVGENQGALQNMVITSGFHNMRGIN